MDPERPKGTWPWLPALVAGLAILSAMAIMAIITVTLLLSQVPGREPYEFCAPGLRVSEEAVADVCVSLPEQNGRYSAQAIQVFRQTCPILVRHGDPASVDDDWSATAFFIDQGTAITAAHAIPVDGADSIMMFCRDDADDRFVILEAEVERIDYAIDIAILRASNPHAVELTLSENLPSVHTRLTVYGFYETVDTNDGDIVLTYDDLRTSTGIVPQATFLAEFPADMGRTPPTQEDIRWRKDMDREAAMLSGMARRGNSGGPVVTDDGVVVGVLVALRVDFSRSALIPSRTVLDFIESEEED